MQLAIPPSWYIQVRPDAQNYVSRGRETLCHIRYLLMGHFACFLLRNRSAALDGLLLCR